MVGALWPIWICMYMCVRMLYYAPTTERLLVREMFQSIATLRNSTWWVGEWICSKHCIYWERYIWHFHVRCTINRCYWLIHAAVWLVVIWWRIGEFYFYIQLYIISIQSHAWTLRWQIRIYTFTYKHTYERTQFVMNGEQSKYFFFLRVLSHESCTFFHSMDQMQNNHN